MINDLLKLGKKYKNLVVLSSGTGGSGICEEFEKYFPDRYFSFGLGEGNMVSAAAGFALMGKIPVIVSDGMWIFSRAFDQIKTDVCEMNLNVKFIVNTNETSFENDRKLLNSFPNFEMDSSLENCINEYGVRCFKCV
jgi:transketolase